MVETRGPFGREPSGGGDQSMSEHSIELSWMVRIWGALLVALALVINYELLGAPTIVLGIALLIAYLVWAFGRWTHIPARVLPLYLVGIAVQSLHIGEAYLTGFQRDFPALFGSEWSDSRFLSLNLAWLALFALGAAGMMRRIPLAYLVVIFFVLMAEIVSGIGHLALSIARRQYFPGMLTATVALFVGLTLIGKLLGRVPEGLAGGETNAG